MPVACFAHWYTWLRPEAASKPGYLGAISTSAPRPQTPITPCFAFVTIRLWYDITVFAAVLSFHNARYRSCDVKTACMLSYICEIPAIYTTSYTATI